RDFDRGGAAVGEEYVIEAGRGDGDEPLREVLGRLVREACEDHLVQMIGRFFDRRHDAGMTVAVGDDPPGRNRIEDAPTVRCLEPGAVGARHHDGGGLQRMLREGMPNRRLGSGAHLCASYAKKSARRKFSAKAVASDVRSSLARWGRRPSRFTLPISAMV